MMEGASIVRGIVGQARPILIGQFAAMAFAVVDTVLSGRASSVDLATMGLGLSVYSTVFVGLMGATSALNPIVAQHFGGGRLAAIGATYVQGLWMALFLSGLGVLPLLFAGLWLPWLHAPSKVEAHVARYLRVLALALPGALMFRAIYGQHRRVAPPRLLRRPADGRELRAPGRQAGDRAHRDPRRRAVGGGCGRRLPFGGLTGAASRACG